MVYCVFLDPSCIEEADQAGEFGYATLFEIMLGLLQNCYLADTKAWTVGPALRNAIESISDQDARLRASELLAIFEKRKRFLNVIDCDSEDQTTACGEVAIGNWQNPLVDHLILGREVFRPLPKTSTLPTYSLSGFSLRRSESVQGKSVARGHYDFSQIFSQYFRRIIQSSAHVKIIDPIVGSNFNDNYSVNLRLWIEQLKSLETPIRIELHTECGRKRSDNLRDLKESIVADCDRSNITFSVVPYGPYQLPHERFIVSSDFTLVIGRGLDLIDPLDRKNRDLFVGFASPPFLPGSTYMQM